MIQFTTLNNQPIYILDECLSAKTDFVEGLFVQSIDQVGRGKPDSDVLEYVQKNNLVLITADHRALIQNLAAGYTTVYFCQATRKTVLIEPKIDQNQKYSDPLTYHILESDQVVRP